MFRDLLQIVPLLPPAFSGIGDYALLLARELRGCYEVQTHFVSAEIAWNSPELVAPFTARAVTCHRTEAMASSIRETLPQGGTILLHYVGYGYARRGCPFWLVKALEEWKRQSPSNRLIVLFHELYASGPLWSSAFWSLPIQKSLAGRLAQIGDLLLTPTSIVSRLVQPPSKRSRKRGIEVLPVFSTIGEPINLRPLAQRKRQMVVFGSPQWRKQAYTQHADSLVEACGKMELRSIIDVGPPTNIPSNLALPIHSTGTLPAAETSLLFEESMAGFFTYPVFVLGKSTIFAAYCAHGMVPITYAGNAASTEDRLFEGKQYLVHTDSALASLSSLACVANSATDWYSGHSLKVHAQRVSGYLEAVTSI